MSTALKVFGAFNGILLEARVGTKVKDEFITEYSCRSGLTAVGQNAFMVRENNGWPGGVDTRTYFDAPQWVVNSLKKLGFRIVKRQIDMDKYEGGLREYPWKVCSQELFWWLVDYGYRIGKNETISFDLHNLRQTLIKMRDRKVDLVPMVQMILKESENPIEEALLLAV